MTQVTKSKRGVVAKLKAAVFVIKKKRWRIPTPAINANIAHKAFNLAAVTALSLNIIATGLPYLIANYNDSQARIPHALAADEKLSAPPAADAGPSGDKAVSLSSSLKDQLAGQLKKERDDKPRDSRPSRSSTKSISLCLQVRQKY
jgi:hypothetical protein